MIEWVDLTTNMEGPLFTKEEIAAYARHPLETRKRRIENEFLRRVASPPYSALTSFEKYKYCLGQIKQIRSDNLGCFSGGCLGFMLGSVISSTIGGPIGILCFLAVTSLSAYLGNEMSRSNADLLIPLYENQLQIHKDIYNAEKKVHADEVAAQAAEQKALEAKAKAEAKKVAARESERIYKEMLEKPATIKENFALYKDHVRQEIESASPDKAAVSQAAFNHGLGSAFLSGLTGISTSGYTPSEDEKFTMLISLLGRERQRMKGLAHNAPLPFAAIEHFQEVSRVYLGLHRPGGNSTIYDETMIQNEVMAMKESVSVQGDYIDNSLRIDRSINTRTTVQNATVESDRISPERIKKEIIRGILASRDESISRVELLSIIAASESEILSALEELQAGGLVRIFNRASGEIVYGIDRLA